MDVCNDYAEQKPLNWYNLCVTITDRCIVLPIECSKQETALTIFSTLNDRGMPLDDSDIFKAEIYRRMKTKEARVEFTEQWKDLSQTCSTAKMSTNDLFRYYTHVMRARKGMGANVKEIGLRRFYAENNYERLGDKILMSEMMKLANFWYCLNTGHEPEVDEGYTISLESRKFIDCLFYYPNEYWKYVATVYFMKYSDTADFEDGFCRVLKKITAFMFAKFLSEPTVNAVRPDVLNACVAIENEQDFWTDIDPKFAITGKSFYSSTKLTRSLLLLHAYLHPKQNEIIPRDFHIEHILPRKWQETSYNSWNYDQAKKWLDSFGNRVVFENKLNIQAGNGYFGRKKPKYKKSVISDVLDLADFQRDDFTVNDIEKREEKFMQRIKDFFNSQSVI